MQMHSLGCRSGPPTHPDPIGRAHVQDPNTPRSKCVAPDMTQYAALFFRILTHSDPSKYHISDLVCKFIRWAVVQDRWHTQTQVGDPIKHPVCNTVRWAVIQDPRHTQIQVSDPSHDPACKCIRWAVVHDPQHTPIPVCDPISDLECECIHCRRSGSPSPPESTSMTPTKT
jgi:hypothetical protein